MSSTRCEFFIFFFNDTATTEIYTLSLHDALPISERHAARAWLRTTGPAWHNCGDNATRTVRCDRRSEEHTSELQSRQYLVCRLLLEKKTKTPFSTLPTSPSPFISLRSSSAHASLK